MNLDRRLIAQLHPVRLSLALAIGFGTLAGILLVGQAYALSQVVSRAFLDGQNVRDVRDLLALLVIVAILRAAALWTGEVAAHEVAGRIKADLRERLFAHLIALGPAYTRGERSGELANTAVEGIEALDGYFSQYIPQIALSALVPLTMLAVILPLDPLSALVLLLTAPMIPFFMVLIGHLANRQSRKQWTQFSRLSAHFLDTLQGLTTLKVFGRSRAQIAVIARISDEFRDATMNVLRIAFVSALALELLATISTAIIAVEIGLRLLYGRMPFDEAFFILILAPEFYLPLRNLGARFHAGVAGAAAAERIFAVLETEKASTTEDVRHAARRAPGGLTSLAPLSIRDVLSRSRSITLWRGGKSAANQGEGPVQEHRFSSESHMQDAPAERESGRGLYPPFTITFDDVFYAYDSGERPALNGVSFRLAPGQHIALAGPSGAGKSTIAQLLLRFIDPTAGRITVNGVDLRDIPPDAWRAQMAWVPQMPYLFAGTVAENVRLGNPAAPLEAVIRAAQQAHADAFIRALPEGYDTEIGERGARLSGGQAQRIALARAFLRDAPILILDEATANLDPDTEALIQDSIRALLHGRSTLIIAHRLHTLKTVKQIMVLNQGVIRERGACDELIERGGLFCDLIRAADATR